MSRLRSRDNPAPVRDDVLATSSPLVASAEDELLLGVEHGDVGTALRSLSPQLRAVVQATVVDGLTSREKEIVRYARHPVFLAGFLLTALSTLTGHDRLTASVSYLIVPAAGLGLFGVIVMASLVRSSDPAAEAAGTVATGQRTRTLALTGALFVPLVAGLLWFAWAVWAWNHWPVPANGLRFSEIGDGWVYACGAARAGSQPPVAGPRGP